MQRRSFWITACVVLCLTVVLSACTEGNTESEQLSNDTDQSMSGRIETSVDSEANVTESTELISFTISDTVTWMSETGATTSRGFGPGGGGGRRGR